LRIAKASSTAKPPPEYPTMSIGALGFFLRASAILAANFTASGLYPLVKSF